MKSEKSKKKLGGDIKDASATSDLDLENESFAKRLVGLNQQWNPVVKCAVNFLRGKNQHNKTRAWLLDFPYAASVYKDGAWQHDNLPPEVKGAAFGIVLSGRVEVVIEENTPPFTSALVSPIRPRPCVVLLPGAVIGSFEYVDQFVHSKQSYGYSLMAGPVCVQIDHRDYFAFAGNGAGYTALQKALYKSDPTNDHTSLIEWQNSGDNYHLIKAFAGKEAVEKSHATVLIISLDTYSDFLDKDTYILHRALVEVAWRQSGSSRVRTFPAERGIPVNLSKRIKPNHAQGIQSTIQNVQVALQNKVPVWTPFNAQLHDAPALDAFCKKLGEATVDARIKLEKEAVYITSLLSDANLFGSVSIADHLVKIKQEWNSDKKRKCSDALASGQKRNPLVDIEKDLASHLKSQSHWDGKVSIRSWGEKKGFSGKGITAVKEAAKFNPFSRLHLEMTSRSNELNVLEKVTTELKLSNELLQDVLIVACQHLLRETECWFSLLKRTNEQLHIIAIGKDYSTCPQIAKRLSRMGVELVEHLEWAWSLGDYNKHLLKKTEAVWKRVQAYLAATPSIRKVLILDDGGVLISSLPAELRKQKIDFVAVEQTQNGVEKAKSAKISFVNVAESSVKKQVESHLIAKTTLEKSKSLCRSLCDTKAKIGIIGFGAVGEALMQSLVKNGYSNVLSYDPKKQNLPHSVKTPNELIAKSEILFGCSGEDVLTKIKLPETAGKWFISCSSSDVEFKSLLQSEGVNHILPYDLFSTVLVPINQREPAKVLNGGFPVNFDRTPESVPLGEIQLTRGLMHAGLIEALRELKDKVSNPLTISSQRLVLKTWLKSESALSEHLKEVGEKVLDNL